MTEYCPVVCCPDPKTKELYGDKMGDFRAWFQQRLDDAIKASEEGKSPGDPGTAAREPALYVE